MKNLKTRTSADAGAGLAMRVVHRHHQVPAHPQKARVIHRLAVSTKDGLAIIPLVDIAYIKAESNYSTIHTLEGSRYLVSKPLKQFNEQLDKERFVRCHQSYLINCDHVRYLLTTSSPAILLSNHIKIPVSRRQINNVKNSLLTLSSI